MIQFQRGKKKKNFLFNDLIKVSGLLVGFFLCFVVVVVLKALIYLFDSLRKFSGIGESCEGAQQLHHKPKHQACKQVQEAVRLTP